MKLGNYEILDKIAVDRKKIIYRAIDPTNGSNLLIKAYQEDSRFAIESFILNNEYEVLSGINAQWCVKALRVENLDGCPALIMEDPRAVTLHDYCRMYSMDMHHKLKLAIKITTAIAHLHAKGIVYKSISPFNLLITTENEEVKLSEFGLAEKLGKFKESSFVGMGAPDYMSPEQTGRTSRSVDFRSDVYSLGITLYELFCGRRPFEFSDINLLLYAHMTQLPASPYSLNSSMQAHLSDIIMKMIEKEPNDRYQSVQGVLADLEWVSGTEGRGNQTDLFQLGRNDVAIRYTTPVKPYGKAQLLDYMDSVRTEMISGGSRVILLNGESGSGKTYLLGELQRKLMDKDGTVVFADLTSQLDSEPYQAIRILIERFAEYMLSGTTEAQRAFKREMDMAMGTTVQLMAWLFPVFRKLLSIDEDSMATYQVENKTLIERAIIQFGELLVKFDPPLTVLVDGFDLIDNESRQVLLRFLKEQTAPSFMLVGTLQSGMASLVEYRKIFQSDSTGTQVEQITVPEFSVDDIAVMLRDSFKITSKKARHLGTIIFAKTNGNPYYTIELIKTCCEQDWLFFNPEFGEWDYKAADIQMFQTSANVAERALIKLQQLDQGESDVLKSAAVMGYSFSFGDLAKVLDVSSAALRENLAKAFEFGLITGRFRMGDTFGDYSSKSLVLRFSHEAVYEKLLEMTDTADRMKISYAFGNVLKDNSAGTDEELGQLLSHMNFATPMLIDDFEKRDLARMNLEYAIRLKRMGIVEKAFTYTEAGLKLLESREFDESDSLNYKLTLEQAELAYLNRRFDEAEAYFDALIGNCKMPGNRAKAICTKMTLYVNQGRMKETIMLAEEALNGLGIPFDVAPSNLSVGRELLNYNIGIIGKKVEDLEKLTVSTNPQIIMVTEIYMTLVSVSYLVGKNLFMYVILRILNITLKHGLTVHSSYAFSIYGLISGSALGNPKRGLAYGNLGIRLAERFGNQNMLAKCHFTSGFFLNHWVNHPSSNLEHLSKAIDLSDQTGDMVFYSYSVAAYILTLVDSGTPLNDVIKALNRFFDIVQSMQVEDVFNLLVLLRQVIFALRGSTDAPYSLNALDFNEELFVEKLKASSMKSIYAVYLVQKLKLYYLYGQYEAAGKVCSELQGDAQELMGLSVYPEYYQFYSLTLLELGALGGRQRRIFNGNQKKLASWMRYAPQNFRHRYLIVEGMLHHKRGNNSKAVSSLTEALHIARKEGFLQEEALVNELLGRCYDHENQVLVRRMYLKNAYALYRQWGAAGKVDFLKDQYGDIFFEEFDHGTRVFGNGGADNYGTIESNRVDLLSVFKSAQTLSSETRPEVLLKRLLEIISENAGSQKTVVLMKKETLMPVAWSVKEVFTVLEEGKADSCTYSETVVNQVVRSHEAMVVEDVAKIAILRKDPYILTNNPVSLMCVPVMWKGNLMGVLYMENNRISGAFNPNRLEVMQVLTAQFVISYDNALLYDSLRASEGELKVHKYKLERIVEERTAALSHANFEIQMLLDHAGQGFFSFDETERIGSELSRECHRIFLRNISGMRVSELLGIYFAAEETPLLGKIIEKAFQTEEDFQAKVYLSLLPQDLKVNGRNISIEYQMIGGTDGRRVMAILTDVTETRALTLMREEEKRNLRTIVKVIKNRNSFIRSLEDYFAFANEGVHNLAKAGGDPSEVLKEVFRMVHTFKGDFAQWGFANAESALHEIESLIAYQRTEIDSADDLLAFIEEIDFDKAIEKDLQILENAVGKSLLQGDEYYEISRAEIIALENLAENNTVEELRQHIKEMRLINLKDMLLPYDDYVSSLAFGLDKRVNPLRISGDDIRIDRKQYYNLIKVMTHVFRNIMDHGIEEPEERIKQNKSEYGTIAIRIHKESETNMVIEIHDDGRGIDTQKLQSILIANDTAAQTDYREMTEEELMQSVFADGISTGMDISTLSGRGIGLTAVRVEVEKLKGSIHIRSAINQGTAIVIHLPILN